MTEKFISLRNFFIFPFLFFFGFSTDIFLWKPFFVFLKIYKGQKNFIMFTFVIPISNLKESPETAITSLINHPKYVKNIKVAYSGYGGDDDSLYKGWHRHKTEHNIEVIPSMNLKHFSDDTEVIVEVPPYVNLKLGDFENLISQSKECSVTQNQFALGTTFTSNYFNLLHGILMIMTVMEWFINRLWYGNKLINYHDVRARFIIRKGKERYLGNDYSYFWNIWNREVKRKQYGDAYIQLDNHYPQSSDWLLYNNRVYNFGLWILFDIPFYVVISLSFSSLILYTWSPWVVVGAGTGLWSFEILISFLICRHYLRVPYLLVFCFLFPIYWVSFPFILLYFKFSIK